MTKIDQKTKTTLSDHSREAKGWRKVKIGDLVSPVSETFNFENRDKIIFLNTSDVENGHVLNHIKTAISTLPGQAKKKIKRGDILYSEIRPKNKHVARVNFDADNYVVSTKLMVLRPNEKFSADFTYLALMAPRTISDFQTIAEFRSGTFPQITFDAIKDYEVSIPNEYIKQQSIADILSTFDDKIELNNKISRTLEQMAQAIFKEWFIIDNEKLKIKSEKLESICDIIYGKDSPTKDFKKQGFPVYGGNGIIGYSDKYLYSEPQIIIGCRGAYSGNIFKTEPKSFVTHNSLVLEIKEGQNIGINYLFYALQKSNVRSSVTGSAQPQITIAELNMVEIPITDDKLIARFEEVAGTIENYKFKIIKENQKLVVLRDLLLPKLMSGEIKI